MLALALATLHAAVALGLGLLGVVLVDPAPSDGALCVVIAVALVTGRFRLRAAPRPVVAILTVLRRAESHVGDPGRRRGRARRCSSASRCSSPLFGLWLPGYVTSAGRARLIVRAYLFAAVSSALLGLLALSGGDPGRRLLTEGGRARALFQDPNVFGPFLSRPR